MAAMSTTPPTTPPTMGPMLLLLPEEALLDVADGEPEEPPDDVEFGEDEFVLVTV